MRIHDHIRRGITLVASVSLLATMLALTASTEARADTGSAVAAQDTVTPGSVGQPVASLNQPATPPVPAATTAPADQPATTANPAAPANPADTPGDAASSDPAAQGSSGPAGSGSAGSGSAGSGSTAPSATASSDTSSSQGPDGASQTGGSAGDNPVPTPAQSNTTTPAQSNSTTQTIVQVQNLGCTAHCQGSTQAQGAGQQNTTAEVPPPSSGGSAQRTGGATSNITQLQLGCLSHCSGTTTVASDTQQSLDAIDQLLSSGLPTLPSQSSVPAGMQNVVTQSAFQSQDGQGFTGSQSQAAEQSNATLQASFPIPSLSDLVPVGGPSSGTGSSQGDVSSPLSQLTAALNAVSAAVTEFEASLGAPSRTSSGRSSSGDPSPSGSAASTSSPAGAATTSADPATTPFAQVINQVEQGIWQLQIGCLIFCAETQQSQQAMQSDTTIFVLPDPSSSSNQTATAVTTTYQLIWQLQIGCLFWCDDAVETQTATTGANVVIVTPAPPSPPPGATGGSPSQAPGSSAPTAGGPPSDATGTPASTMGYAPSNSSAKISSPQSVTVGGPKQPGLVSAAPADSKRTRAAARLLPMPIVGPSFVTVSTTPRDSAAPPASSPATSATVAPTSPSAAGLSSAFVAPVTHAPPSRTRRHTALVSSQMVIGGAGLGAWPVGSAAGRDDTTGALLGVIGLIALLLAGAAYRKHRLSKT